MVVNRNMLEPSNFNVNLTKVSINLHLLVNELCECTSCVWFPHYCDQHNAVINIKTIALALFYNVSLLLCPGTQHLSSRIPADAGFLRDKLLCPGPEYKGPSVFYVTRRVD